MKFNADDACVAISSEKGILFVAFQLGLDVSGKTILRTSLLRSQRIIFGKHPSCLWHLADRLRLKSRLGSVGLRFIKFVDH